MREDLLNAAAAAIEIAKAAGADHAYANTSRTRGSEFRYRNGALEKAQEDTSRSLDIRLYVDGRYSGHSTTDLRPDRLKGFIAEAVAMTRALEPDPHRKITDPSLFKDLPTQDLDLIDPKLAGLTIETRLEWLAQLEAASTAHDRVIASEPACYDDLSHGAMVGTNGFEGTWETTSLWLGVEITVQDEGDRRPQTALYMGTRHHSDQPTASAIGAQALKLGTAQLGSQKGPTMTTTMVVEPRVAGRLIGHLLRANRASHIQQERSFWAGLKGEKVFSDALTIIDNPLLVRGMGSTHFDGEGIAARKMAVVEAGVVQNYYVDTYYGSKAGMAPTTGGPTNIIVSPGSRALPQIAADLDEGILVTGWLGGNTDFTTGDFSLGCEGHLIKDGKIGGPINEMNVTGNLTRLFSALIEVGNDPWRYGKSRIPTLVFDGVQFSGA